MNFRSSCNPTARSLSFCTRLHGYGIHKPKPMVTGATAGIGKAYAHELAKRGLNVVLISRSLEKLKQVAAEIEEQHSRSTRVIQMDFTEGSESYEPIRDALQGLEIGILVNNVGMTIPLPLHFLHLPGIDKYIPDLVNCNILSTLKMTQIILPQMVARKKGIVINISSILARRPMPLHQIYAASKTFLDLFARGLDREYRSKGIIVQSVLPAFVDSNMTAKYAEWGKIPADVFAHKALNTVGLTNRTSGTLMHSIQVYSTSLQGLPEARAFGASQRALGPWLLARGSCPEDQMPSWSANQKQWSDILPFCLAGKRGATVFLQQRIRL
ncbi:very-long-chain 3-oxoacyl-CoA reductase-like [Tiliqua scincoides]|uniref:very-long-chain 3-oxoacyl-CoA reductase-like n=1 Tax=Tiliqua scincoides TaxID=71010 RepID=UPI0034625A26